MSRKQKKVLVRILISAALWIACYFPSPIRLHWLCI